jgi:hypothetical protein
MLRTNGPEEDYAIWEASYRIFLATSKQSIDLRNFMIGFIGIDSFLYLSSCKIANARDFQKPASDATKPGDKGTRKSIAAIAAKEGVDLFRRHRSQMLQ